MEIQEKIPANCSANDDSSSLYSSNDYHTALEHHKSCLNDYLTASERAAGGQVEAANILNLRRYLDPMLQTANLIANRMRVKAPSWRKILPTQKPSLKDAGMLKNPFWGLAFAAAARLYRGQVNNAPVATWAQKVGVAHAGILALYNTHAYWKQLNNHNLIKDFKKSHLTLAAKR
ncbi:MAG TPA: hypothetical protein VGT41_04505 [Candidatus Babeliales bacterium]|nr:hypothetical protein [Candidatus Babeliales bacterium]